MKEANCPACKTTFLLGENQALNDLVDCPNCKAILEIVQLDPPELAWPDDPITSPSSRKHRDW
ncbi:MAG: hypothetical protein ACK2T7_13895 [Anaerolineales bacterium]